MCLPPKRCRRNDVVINLRNRVREDSVAIDVIHLPFDRVISVNAEVWTDEPANKDYLLLVLVETVPELFEMTIGDVAMKPVRLMFLRRHFLRHVVDR